ncbi:MAG: GNAT family N-acetyltransferase [Chloroflexi bacterium]|nr:GNAT family N-acetyltransferase [Chloroflexota bacterium]
MHIRYYHPEDDPALMALERLCPRGLPEPFVHYRRRFIDRAALFSDHQLLVAEHEDRVVGVAAVCVKRTHIGDDPVSLGYVFDVRTDPEVRRQGIGWSLVAAIDGYLKAREVDGVYAHIVVSNVPSLKLFDKLGYERVRQVMLLVYQPFPAFDFPEYMPRHVNDIACDQDLVRAVHSGRDLYVPNVAKRVKDFGFERWSVDMGDAQFAGISLFDQSYVFQQWPAHLPFPSEEEMRERGEKSLRLFDEVGIHSPDMLRSLFDNLRDMAVTDNVSKLTLLLDRMDKVPQFMFSEAHNQMDYWMVFKSLREDWKPKWQDQPMYVDAREL